MLIRPTNHTKIQLLLKYGHNMSIPFKKLVANECKKVYIVGCFEPTTPPR